MSPKFCEGLSLSASVAKSPEILRGTFDPRRVPKVVQNSATQFRKDPCFESASQFCDRLSARGGDAKLPRSSATDFRSEPGWQSRPNSCDGLSRHPAPPKCSAILRRTFATGACTKVARNSARDFRNAPQMVLKLGMFLATFQRG